MRMTIGMKLSLWFINKLGVSLFIWVCYNTRRYGGDVSAFRVIMNHPVQSFGNGGIDYG
jgi:hypothetical protein